MKRISSSIIKFQEDYQLSLEVKVFVNDKGARLGYTTGCNENAVKVSRNATVNRNVKKCTMNLQSHTQQAKL